jgi:predicted O-methyltransferase YrrM
VEINLEFRSDAMIDSIEGIEGIVAASATIPGWSSSEGATQVALASLGLPDRATIVEVGAFMGRSTALLAGPRKLRGSGKVHSIDPFDCSGDAFSVPYYVAELKAAGSDSLEGLFRANMSRLGLDSWVEVHKGTSRDAIAYWSQPVDLLFLDGDQSPEGSREAFDAWMPFIKPGGTIILRNTGDREYALGHDGNRRLAMQEVIKPRFSAVRQVRGTTFAIKDQ